jgi:hypothetical protein
VVEVLAMRCALEAAGVAFDEAGRVRLKYESPQ